jgi:hypothetical protein
MKAAVACFFALLAPVFGWAGGSKGQWMLEKSEVSRVVNHPTRGTWKGFIRQGKRCMLRAKLRVFGGCPREIL